MGLTLGFLVADYSYANNSDYSFLAYYPINIGFVVWLIIFFNY